MSEKIIPLRPLKVKINFWNSCKLWFMALVSVLLWLALIFAGFNILAHYVLSVIQNGFFAEETLKYAVIIVVGAYFCIVLDKNKIYDALNVRRDLPFITVEQSNEPSSTKKVEGKK